MTEKLLELWLEMHSLAGNRKGFRHAQDAFNRAYRRADYQVQGQYHHLLARDHKRAMEHLG